MTSSPSLNLTDVSPPVICARTATVWNASDDPMTVMASGMDFCSTTAVETGTTGVPVAAATTAASRSGCRSAAGGARGRDDGEPESRAPE